MSEIVKSRLMDICPNKQVSNMSFDDIVKDTHIAFEIIGYDINNLEDIVLGALANFKGNNLGEFVYEVWRCSK